MIYALVITAAVVFILVKIFSKRNISLISEHFLITGGSSGIGLSLAIGIIQRGGSVTLIARSEERLQDAKIAITTHRVNKSQKILTFAADVSKDHERLVTIAKEAEDISGPISCLVCCAGTSVSYRFEETPIEDFSKLMDINYLGSVFATRAILPLMKARKSGRIVFVSSLAGLGGLYGYTSYCASKFALVGLAEALQMEVTPFNISITVSFPPDTDTPGYAEEMKCKPIETHRLSETAGLFSSERVSEQLLMDTMKGKFMSSVGFEGWLLCSLCCGMTPVCSFFELALQALTMGLFRLVAFIYLINCDRTVRQCAAEKENSNILNKESAVADTG